MTSHELIGFMPAELANDVVEFAFANDKDTYKAVLAGVAGALKVRPLFLERKSRKERHPLILNVLSRASQELVAGNLIRSWLLKKHTALIAAFLDALGIEHKEGVVDDVPASMPDEKLKPAVEAILAKFPAPLVSVYLNVFNEMNDPKWSNLEEILTQDSRLQF